MQLRPKATTMALRSFKLSGLMLGGTKAVVYSAVDSMPNSKPCAIGERSGSTRAVVGITSIVSLALIFDGCDLGLGVWCRRGSSVDLGTLVREERSDSKCAIEVTLDLDLQYGQEKCRKSTVSHLIVTNIDAFALDA